MALEVVGERRLAQLLEHGPAVLGGERVLDELLGDRRGALLRRAGDHVLPDGAGDALVVDAVVLVEAPVLDRDHGLLHHRGDLRGVEQDPALVVGQRRELVVVGVVDDRVLGLQVLLAVLERRQVLGDGHHDPEDPGDEREQPEAEDDEGEAELAHPRLVGLLRLLGGGEGGDLLAPAAEPSRLALAAERLLALAQLLLGPPALGDLAQVLAVAALVG